MKKLKQTATFKRDFKRETKGPQRKFLFENFGTLIQTLAKDEPLEERHRDHPLGGEWKDHRDYPQPGTALI